MIHILSDIQSKNIGEGTNIWQFVVVLPGARIGCNCNINCNCFIENDVVIGDDVTVKCGVYLWDGARIGNGAFIGPGVTFTNDLFPRSKKYPSRFLETIVGAGASIGANATILAGVEIGEFSLIGAGSVVTDNTAPYSLYYGNPARRKGLVCRCGRKLDETLLCQNCGRRYFRDDSGAIVIVEAADHLRQSDG